MPSRFLAVSEQVHNAYSKNKKLGEFKNISYVKDGERMDM